ncbi:MAG TPA: MBL fold metallo-hydrolase [Candidatus Pacearchaeota archaeon]|nr:MBL fold metallo-hydrolase [Candidatus Pacearchaeota archaeon]HOU45574.1 MBL fold metallo-hydrolase [Candidatus Pacearchaeota archaeon]HPM08437.1 MBL fold metallo-hydrolase [Candidatus Pacearchaeota archaeon]HQI74269.1 MBL fold metallo-hydrolase [Candidatus Pacearchaeota archaeon]
MHIYWKGQSCFNIMATCGKGETLSILIDPIDPKTDTKLSKQKSDVCIFTNNQVSTEGLDGFIINEPGEYEIKGIYIKGIGCPDCAEKERTDYIYTIEAEEMKICHLGNLKQKELSSKQLSAIGEIDILMIPVGGDYVLDEKEAAEIINQIEPRIVIPMVYKTDLVKTKLEDVKVFLKEVGEAGKTPQDKLLIKKKDLDNTEGEVVVLQP